MRPAGADVQIDLSRVRTAAVRIARDCGVPVIAVVKADAYGLGAAEVARALADTVAGFYVFDLAEAQAANLRSFGKPILALHAGQASADECLALGVRPAVWDATAADRLRAAHPVIAIDTGQQRFACEPQSIDAVLKAGRIDEAFTHATRAEHVARFAELTASRSLIRHAAGSSLLADPAARFDAVRPGLALYEHAVRVTAPLIEIHRSNGPAGYTGFVTPHFGVIRVGYVDGLRIGPAAIEGRVTRIVEVGMQSAFVELAGHEGIGDAVELLGDAVPLADVAAAWKCSPQNVLVALTRAGERHYR